MPGDLVIEDNGKHNMTIAASTIFTHPALANWSTYNVTVAQEVPYR